MIEKFKNKNISNYNSKQMSKKNMKVRMTAEFNKLNINKNIRFQTKILWKRHNNKAETNLVNHEHGYSIFNQILELDLNLSYDESQGLYEDKNTEVVAIIMFEGKIKSGGYAKYNVSQVINHNLANQPQTIALTQCPDPNASVEVTFNYHFLDEAGDTTSVLNASSRDLNMSRVDFNDDKLSLEMERIHSTINKLNDLAKIVKNRQKSSISKIPQLLTKIELIEGEKLSLKVSLQKLQKEMNLKESQHEAIVKKDKKTIADLEKQLQKKGKQFRSRQFIEIDTQNSKTKSKEEEKQYKNLYEEALKQIEGYKESEMLRKSFGFAAMEVEDVQEIAHFQQDKEMVIEKLGKSYQKQMQVIKQENNELQTNLATMSYKLAQLFNASYEYGGAKLLDYLQTSIGLTQI